MPETAASSKKKARGWVVRVTTMRFNSLPSVEIYEVATADPADAIAAVREFSDPAIVEAIQKLPLSTRLEDGDILWR